MTDHIRVFTQSSIQIKGQAGVSYLDPFRIPGEPHDADFIFITHDHYDHYSPEDIRKVLNGNTVIIVPEKMMKTVTSDISGYKDIIKVRPGIHETVNGLEFETVPAYNNLKPFHPKSAGWVGYILHVDDKRIYAAGDTDATQEAMAVKCDIALIPIGGTYTMDAQKAAELVNVIKPEIAIPIHYGSIVGKPGDAEVFAANVKEPVKVETKIKF